MAVVLVVALIALGAGAAYFWKDIERRIKKTDVNVTAAGGGVLNILVIGTDYREGAQSREDLKRFGKADGKRADTIILMQVVPSEKRAVLVQFPRDLWVPIPGKGTAKINSAFAAGADKVIETVEQLSGVPVNHYVEVNFYGFRALVDAIGGIDVCLDRPMRDSVLQFRLPAGVSHLGGNEALTYVRSRHSDADGDFGRIRRQQQFMRTVVAKLGRPSVLLNPFKVRSLATAFASNVTTDQDFKLTDMARLAQSVRSVSPEAMRSYTVPGEVGSTGGQSVVFMDRDRAEALFQALRDKADPEQALAPKPVPVVVEDASGKNLGRRVGDDLGQRGFQVTGVTEAPAPQKATSVISPRASANDARRLVGIVPGAKLLFGGTEIRLVLGSSFTGLTQAPKGEAPAPSGPCADFDPGAQ